MGKTKNRENFRNYISRNLLIGKKFDEIVENVLNSSNLTIQKSRPSTERSYGKSVKQSYNSQLANFNSIRLEKYQPIQYLKHARVSKSIKSNIQSSVISNIPSKIQSNVNSISHGSITSYSTCKSVQSNVVKCRKIHSATHIMMDNDANSIVAIDDISSEFSKENISKLTNTSYDPERFLKLAPPYSDIPLLNREVNAVKIYHYFVDFFESYYNISEDANPNSKWRESLNEKLLKNFTFIIPVLCKQVINVLQSEETIVTLEPNVIVFGDIHGNLNDLYYINTNIFMSNKYSQFKFVFLGDYVDRGSKSVEVMIFLFAIKLINPKRFILLRGNHEVIKVNKKYGFKKTIEQLFSNVYFSKKDVLHTFIYNSYNEAFNHLPLGALIRFKNRKGIFCCHGGVPNEQYNNHKPWTIEAINKLGSVYKPHDLVPRKHASNEQCALHELLWNDPLRDKQNNSFSKKFTHNRKRGGHCSKFSEEAANRFLNINHLRLLIRGHQFQCCKGRGYYSHFSDQILTVFSSSNYCYNNNATGYVIITDDYVHPLTLRFPDESKLYFYFNQSSNDKDDLRTINSSNHQH